MIKLFKNKKDREIYKKIVEEQHYCQLCGSTNWLEIHHIYYRSQGGSNDERNQKAIEYIEQKKLQPRLRTVNTYSLQERQLLDILKGSDIKNGI